MRRKIIASLFSLAWLLGFAVSAAQRVAPHVTPSGASIQTFISLENTSGIQQNYSLQPYSINGKPLAVITGRVSPFERVSLTASQLLGPSATHFSMDAPDSIKLNIEFQSGANKQVLSVASDDARATSWTFSASNLAAQNQALAVVNLGKNATPVWLHQYDGNHRIVASQRLSSALAPNAKLLHLIDPSRFKSGPDFTMEVIGDQNLALLNLTSDSAYKLSANPIQSKREAESERDDVGIWFITGGSLSDVFEMMGYNVATDRMWQGELLRRTGAGRLAEIFGPSLVGQDSQVRVTGYSQEQLQSAFDNLSEDEKTIISSYVAGFNRRIAEIRADASLMPFEFLALGLTDIDDWTTNDVLAWAVTLQHNFAVRYGAIHQLSYLSELQNLAGRYGVGGAAMFLDMHWINDPHAQVMVPDPAGKVVRKAQAPMLPLLKAGIPDVTDIYNRLNEQNNANIAALQSIGAYFKGGSYAWVVAGDKTASGNPILYSGPQLEGSNHFQAPAIVQEGSIRGGGIEVSGMNITGIPAIIVGRTPHHAWSLQVGHANFQDLYFDSPSDVVSQRVEVIKVAGGEDVYVPVVHTRHGVALNADPLITHKSAMTNYEFGFVKATLNMARAHDMDSFGEAVADLAVSMHICYADVDKNIAYWHTGRQPVRPRGVWMLPQGTVAAPLEWNTDVIEPLVHDRNNPQGFYGGWNNKASNDIDDLGGAFRFTAWHGGNTITEFLKDKENLTFDEVAAIAPRIAAGAGSIIAGNSWRFIGRSFSEAVHNNPTPERLAALAMIEAWNGIAIAGVPAEWPYNRDYQDPWVLQDTWMVKVVELTFGDELNSPVFEGRYGRTMTLYHLLEKENGLRKSYNWFRNRTGGVSGKDNIITTALDMALASLGERAWGENARPMTTFDHPLLGDMVDLVPGLATPLSNRATYAQCVEYGETGPVKIGSLFLLGQSGEILLSPSGSPVINPNAFTMAPYFSSFQLRPFRLFD